MKRFTFAAFAALFLVAPAAAQDGSEASAARTPENAQRFLSVVAAQYPIVLTPTAFRYNSDIGYTLSYKPVRISADDRCVTRFDGDVQQFYAKDDSGTLVQTGDLDPVKNAQLLAMRGDLVAKYKLKTAPYVIDWSKVTYLGKIQTEPYSQVTKKYAEVDGSIGIAMGDVVVGLYPPDPELAQRMMLAMQTLKQACDVTGGLGF